MLGFIISAFSDEIDEKLDVQMDVLEECGISFIEMRGVDGKNISSFTVQEITEVKKRIDARGFKVSSLGSPIGKIKITDDFAEELEKYKNTLELCKILESKYIRMFSFFLESGTAEKYRNEVMDRLGKYVELAKEYDVILLHENEKDIYGDTADRCLDIFKTLNTPNLRATFDPANFIQCGVEPYPYAFELLKPYIEYLHIKDAKKADGQICPAGLGDGKIKETLKNLKDLNYNGFLSLEPHLANFKGFAELEGEGVSIKSMEMGGRDTFKIACDALNKILNEID